MNTYQQQEREFFEVLQNIFIGAKIEGESGYVNLMRIKSNYYATFKQTLEKDMEAVLAPFNRDFREEFYNKLYTFFKKYFSESGAIYFSYAPLQEKIYERVYLNDQDVTLFWKTHMLYYVKTEQLFQNLTVELGSYLFYFDVTNLQHKKNNEKRELLFELLNSERIDKKTHLHIAVSYALNGKRQDNEKILKAIRAEGNIIAPDLKTFERALTIFKRQSEVDYFINKNARSFLREQFSLWIKGYLMDDETVFEPQRLAQLKALQFIAFKIIDLVSQFEDELVRIWNKPKFAHSAHYVITLDKIADKNPDLLHQLFQHAGIILQTEEWQQLGCLEPNTNLRKNLFLNDLNGSFLNPKYQHLPLDTQFFKSLEPAILELFDDLDQQLNGWLIHSENYQALNTLQRKFYQKIQTVYIDPPFNTGSDFDYEDKFQDASWLTLTHNRIEVAKNFMNDKSCFYLHLDHNADYLGRFLMDSLLGKDKFQNKITWRRQIPRGKKVDATFYSYSADFILLYADKQKSKWKILKTEKELTLEEAEKKYQKDGNGYFRTSDPGSYSNESLIDFFNNGRIYVTNGGKAFIDESGVLKATKGSLAVKYYREQRGNKIIEEKTIDNIWSDVAGMGIVSQQYLNFSTQKPEKLLQRVIASSTDEGDLMLDFFSGSGTTVAAAQKLNRKWIGVEMGAHFYSVTLPRLKRVLYGEQGGISKEVGWQGGGFFKYFSLEQYEETLAKVEYSDSDAVPTQSVYTQYLFLKDLKLAAAVAEEGETVTLDLRKLHPDIDIAETLSLLRGKWIKSIKGNVLTFTDGECIDLQAVDLNLIKPLIWW